MRWKTGLFLIVAIAIGGGGFFAWQQFKPAGLPPGFASSNGRIEAERTDIATKFAGRIKEVMVDEGDVVKAGQILVRMDSAYIEAQALEARAATEEVEQQLDQRSAARLAAKSAEAGVKRVEAGTKVAIARTSRLEENLKDYVLKAPVSGRVQYRLAQPGEVVGVGGKIITVLDLTDVYMTIFLPTREADKLEIGAQARIVPDAASQYVVPATVSFVASEAQFTPK